MNPNGLVPTIKDGDFVLWESNSIMRYLNAKYGNGKLLPASPEGMANANRWMDWQLSAFNPDHRAAVFRDGPNPAGKTRSPGDSSGAG